MCATTDQPVQLSPATPLGQQTVTQTRQCQLQLQGYNSNNGIRDQKAYAFADCTHSLTRDNCMDLASSATTGKDRLCGGGYSTIRGPMIPISELPGCVPARGGYQYNHHHGNHVGSMPYREPASVHTLTTNAANATTMI
uniref:Uncharacterized protein n=1 Tax=Macrostomum lignano TaxID=282301 RepID=A0A1I8GZM2_9PLAT